MPALLVTYLMKNSLMEMMWGEEDGIQISLFCPSEVDALLCFTEQPDEPSEMQLPGGVGRTGLEYPGKGVVLWHHVWVKEDILVRMAVKQMRLAWLT